MITVKALHFPIDALPAYVELEPTLDNLQSVVEGNIELLPIPEEPRAIAVVNDEAKLWGLAINTWASRRMYRYEELRGPVLVMGHAHDTSEDGIDHHDNTREGIEFSDIPPELAAYYIARCNIEAEGN
jgi:hypothetical protein